MVSLDVATTPSARERILCAAYELFSRRGIRAVGTDEVIAVRRRGQGHALPAFRDEKRLGAGGLGASGTTLDLRFDRGAIRDYSAKPPRSSCWRSSTSCTTGSKAATVTKAARSSTCCSSWGRIIPPGVPASLISTTSATSCADALVAAGLTDVEDFASVLAHPDEGRHHSRGRR